ncbi:RidA family protein [Algoriphagus namhaensis]
MANIEFINPMEGSYSQGMKILAPKELVFISGQIPKIEGEPLPDDFKTQCEFVWRNIESQLKDVGMKLTDIVKFTTFLSDRIYREEHYQIRNRVLKGHKPAMTIIITGIYDESWLLEIEVIAAK